MRSLFTIISVLLVFTTGNAQDTLLKEVFDKGEQPSGWFNINNLQGSGSLWAFDNPGNRNNSSPITTPTAANGFAIFDADAFGPENDPHDADMIAPPVNCGTYDSIIQLKFNHVFNVTGDADGIPFPAVAQVGKVLISTNGSDWQILRTYTTENPGDPVQQVTINITAIAKGKPQVFVKFNFTGGYEQYWVVDDVYIIARKSANPPAAPIPPATADDEFSALQGVATNMNVLANDTVKAHPFNISSLQVKKEPKYGFVNKKQDGTFEYTSLAQYAGIDSFTYAINDTAGTPSRVTKVVITVGTSTVVKDKNDVTNTFTFTNPVNSKIDLNFSNNFNGSIEIVSLTGKYILKQDIVQEKRVELDISTLSKGVYFLKVVGTNSQEVRRFVKN